MQTPRSDVVDDYHGTPVADPYRWLEDAASPETVAWVEEQDAATERYLDTPERAALRDRLAELLDYPRYGAPWRAGDRYYAFFKNDGLQNQAVLYIQDTLDSPPRVLLDPNALSADGTVALTNLAFSRDGTLCAYGLSTGGSDWQELRVRDVATGVDLPDRIQWCRFTPIAWKHDGSGFFYARYPEPGSVPPEDTAKDNRVYWHAIGSPQAADALVYERPDARELAFSPTVTEDGAYLVLEVWHGTDPKNRLYYRPLDGDGDVVRLLDDADAHYGFVGSDGPVFYVHTDRDAPRGRVVAIDARRPDPADWRELVPEAADAIADVRLVNHQLVVVYLRDASHVVRLFTLDGRPAGSVPLPALGSVEALHGKPHHTELFLSYATFLTLAAPFRYDFATGELTQLHAPELRFDPSAYTTEQVFYTSRDGTRIPMFLIHRRDLARDGRNPTLLYGYGGFNISLTPGFSSGRIAWLEAGGVHAIANLRGGAEYGEAWHQAGMLERKQNVFDDFIAAAEWLIASGFTSPARLATNGGSNGGLLVAACLVQRPELYGAVVCQVPVVDMLRYHRFTVGRYWIPEYGNAETEPEHFRFLYAYSPLHNVRPGVAYPPVLITSADTDDRVVPAHAKKFAATLQEANGGPNPVLMRVETRAGHGAGKPTAKVIEEAADIYAFLFRVFGMRLNAEASRPAGGAA